MRGRGEVKRVLRGRAALAVHAQRADRRRPAPSWPAPSGHSPEKSGQRCFPVAAGGVRTLGRRRQTPFSRSIA